MTDQPVDEIARRFSRRPGYRLVTYREVGLPFWDVPLRCRILARKPLPVLDEFVLRSIEADLRVSADISEFLGLPLLVTEAIMGRLVTSNHLLPTRHGADEIRFSLSPRGRDTLRQLAEVTPKEEVLNVSFDGLTLDYLLVDNSMRWRPRDLRDHDILEVPAFPADPPPVGPSDTSVVSAALQVTLQRTKNELLKVLAIEGKREKFYLKALALIFESADEAGEFSVHFVIDGRPSEQHDLAFARAEGQRKLGIVDALRDANSAVSDVVSQDIAVRRTDDPEISAIRRMTEGYRSQLASLERRASVATDDQKSDLVDQAAAVAEKLDEAESALQSIPARVLDVHEHPPMLSDALENTKNNLVIVSPWIRAAVVTKSFLDSIRHLVQNGVNVAIGYGIGDDAAAQKRDAQAEAALAQLASEFPNLLFTRLGDTHAKVLIVDDRYAIVTSFNWLSFKGDPNRPFRDERGTLINLKAEVLRLREDYLGRISGSAQSAG